MQDNKSVKEYLSRVVTIVNLMKAIGYKLSKDEVMGKVLRSLSSNGTLWLYSSNNLKRLLRCHSMS